MNILRALRKALACAVSLVCVQVVAAPVWFDDAGGTFYAVDAARAAQINSMTAGPVRAAAADAQGRLWLLTDDAVVHIDAAGVRDRVIELVSVGAAGADRIRADAFDGSVWVADSARLVHLDVNGHLLGTQLLPEAIRDFVVAPDQSLWLLADKRVLHYGAAGEDQGRLLESWSLARATGRHGHLYVDSLRRRLWVADDRTLSRLDLANSRAPIDIDLGTSSSVALDALDGWMWRITGGALVAYGASGAQARSVALDQPAGPLVAVDPYGRHAWLNGKDGLWQVNLATGRATRVEMKSGVRVASAAAEGFSPRLQMSVDSASGASPGQDAASIRLALTFLCADQSCEAPVEFAAGIKIAATLDGRWLDSTVTDITTRTATLSLPGAATSVSGVLGLTATDVFGHSSSRLTMQLLAGRIVPGTVHQDAQAASLMSSPVPTAVAAAIRALPLQSPAFISTAEARASSQRDAASLQFELNEGQHHPSVKFAGRSPGFGAFGSSDEVALVLTPAKAASQPASAKARIASTASRDETPQASVVRLQLVGANSGAKPEGLDTLPSRANYLVGKDPRKWRTNVAQYGRVAMHGVYSGIDAIYSGSTGSLEYDFVVSPGADPTLIRQRVVGAQSLAAAPDGGLVVRTESGDVELPAPVLFQPLDAQGSQRRIVDGGFEVTGTTEFTFRIGAYDRALPLVIDPTVVYTRNVGSGKSPLTVIAVDPTGNAYATGQVNSVNFAIGTTTSIGVSKQIYVQKLASNGKGTFWTTFIGGSAASGQADQVDAIAVDSKGSVYVTGQAGADFPTTTGAFQASFPVKTAPLMSSFVAKLVPAGNALSYATFLGGTSSGNGLALAVDATFNAYVTGTTNATDFPVTAGAASTKGGLFVSKLNPAGSALAYSNLFGSLKTTSLAIAVDTAGDAYIGNVTPDVSLYPATSGALHLPTGAATSNQSFVVKFDPTGKQILGSAQIGGIADCAIQVKSLAVDPASNPYIAGTLRDCDSSTTGVPASVMPFQPESDQVAFAAKLRPDLAAYTNFFALPGRGDANFQSASLVNSMAVDVDGSIHLTGVGNTPDIPVANPIAGTPVTEPAGTPLNFVAKINPAGLGLVYLTALNANNDPMTVIAVDASRNVDVGGGRAVTKIAATGTLAVALHSSNGTATAGSTVTLSAVVSGGTAPAGTVQFLDGTTVLATVPLSSGTASFSTTTLALGSHTLTAAYGGDAKNAATNSQQLFQIIYKPLTSTTTLTGQTTIAPGKALALTATITPSATPILPGSATVSFKDGSKVLATMDASYGAPGVSEGFLLSTGVHTLTAVFSGDAEVQGSSSAPITVNVVATTPPTVTLAVTPVQAIYTPFASYTLTVSPKATAPGATISSVTLLVSQVGGLSSNIVGELKTPPYTFPVTGVSEGIYRYSAVVTDNFSNTTTSSTLQTLVHQGPSVTVDTPTANATIAGPVSLLVTGTVDVFNPDPEPDNGSVVSVEFLEGLDHLPARIDAGSMGTSAQFSATYPSMPTGTHTIRSHAKDSFGLEAFSAPRTFTVVSPVGLTPIGAIWSGTSSGQTVAAAGFQVLVKALPPRGGTLFTFQLFENGTLLQKVQQNFLGTVGGGTPVVAWPFTVNTTPGQHTYVAMVSDEAGTSGSTGPLVVNVSTGVVGPTVSIDSPANGAQFAAQSTITLAARALAGPNPIKRMDYYNGSTLLQSVSDGTTALTWPNVPAGIYTITAVATDSANVSTRSAPVTIHVGNPLFGSITSPADGSVFTAPAAVNLTASASTGPTATIAHVDYYQGSTLVGTSTTAPYSFSATSLAAGYYQFTAKIFDSTGATTTTAPVTVQVATLAANGAATTTTTYLLTDVAGSPILATDASGNVLWRESYKPFGERTANAKTAGANRQFFHGKAADPESGLSYFGARYYDPVIGRFMGPDERGFQEGDIQSFGLYAYGANNPYRYRDPDGHSPIDLIFLAVDVAKLGYAVYKGEGVGSALIDVGMSAAGVLIPIPGAGEAMKAARGAEHIAEAVRGAEHTADSLGKVARSCGCFVAGTPIAITAGTMPIEQVTVGMMVLARDEATGKTELKPVTQVFRYEGREIYGVVLLDDKGKASRLEVTDDHPFKVPGQGWVISRDLRPGMLLESLDRTGLKVIHIEDLGRTQPTFNFEVDESHTFFVGEAGVLVHNSGACDLAAKAAKRGGESEKAARGREAHKNYENTLGGEGYEFNKALPSGKRPDAVDYENNIVRELKPNNPRAIRRGEKQVDGYRKELEQMTGEKWTSHVDTYQQ